MKFNIIILFLIIVCVLDITVVYGQPLDQNSSLFSGKTSNHQELLAVERTKDQGANDYFESSARYLSIKNVVDSSQIITYDWKDLFNGKDFEGWNTYIGPLFQPDSNKKSDGDPIGLNKDPKSVFTIVQLEGQSVIRISGEQFGGISTLQEFENYHLQLQFRWGQIKWHPRENKKRDSGLLYHSNGEQGVNRGFWMQSHEFQIQEGDCGDYWGVEGAEIDINATLNGNDWIYNPDGDLITFSEKSKIGRYCRRSINMENPASQWNTLDLYCYGDTSVHVVNGSKVMILTNSKHPVLNEMKPLTKGKIQIQSEGAEVFYREIRIQSINGIPKKYMEK